MQYLKEKHLIIIRTISNNYKVLQNLGAILVQKSLLFPFDTILVLKTLSYQCFLLTLLCLANTWQTGYLLTLNT